MRTGSRREAPTTAFTVNQHLQDQPAAQRRPLVAKLLNTTCTFSISLLATRLLSTTVELYRAIRVDQENWLGSPFWQNEVRKKSAKNR